LAQGLWDVPRKTLYAMALKVAKDQTS
jgi:hypothetical protein